MLQNGWKRCSNSAAGSSAKRMLYRNHMPTSTLQKILMTIGSGVSVLSDPTRTDMLATLGEVTGILVNN